MHSIKILLCSASCLCALIRLSLALPLWFNKVSIRGIDIDGLSTVAGWTALAVSGGGLDTLADCDWGKEPEETFARLIGRSLNLDESL